MNAFAQLTLPNMTTPYNTVTPYTPPVQDEQSRIARTLAGDLGAFNELVLKYQKLAYAVAYRMLQSQDAAEDAVQDSFIKAYRALATFRFGSFKSWLLRIVINTCHDVIRHNRRFTFDAISDEPGNDAESEDHGEVAHQLSDTRESPQAYVERMELHATIELGLRALPVDQRLVLALYDIHGYSYDEISEMTGFALGTVKSRIHRARAKMRNYLLEQSALLPPSFQPKHGEMQH